MTEPDVLRVLAARYAAPSYAFVAGVRNATGFARSVRTADALAFGLWPSRGMEIEGFEIKVSRSDWLRELKEPAKSHEIQRYCDRWWVVAPPDVVDDAEMPPTWGLLVCAATRVRTERPAPQLVAEPLSKTFVASVMRSFTTHYVLPESIADRVAAAKEEERKALAYEREAAARDLVRLRDKVQEFEAAAGVAIDRWDRGSVGKAVAAVLAMGLDEGSVAGHVAGLRAKLARIVEKLDAIAEAS